jgi:hypothetical protein
VGVARRHRHRLLGVIVPLHRGAEPVIDGMTFAFQPVAVVPTINLGGSCDQMKKSGMSVAVGSTA